MVRPLVAAALLAFAVAGPPAPPKGAEGLSALERRGADIFHKGTSPAGAPIVAEVGGSDIRLPGSALPCASCHGPDGLGRPEGGIEPVPLTWDHLTKPYGHRHAGGREHPAFTAASLRAAIAHGTDPAGNRLNPAMPRFRMSEDDLDALIAYLKHLGGEAVPGVTGTEITLGVLLPGDGPLAAAGSAAAALMAAYADEINARQGIYGRSLVLRLERLQGGDPAAAVAAVDRLVEAPVLAVIAAIPPALQPAVAERVEADAVPVFHLWPPAAEEIPDQRRYSFYLLAGLRQEAEGLAAFADRSLAEDRGRAALVVASPDGGGPVVEAVRARWPDATEVAPPTTAAQARRLVRQLKRDGVGLLMVLARGEGVATLLRAAAAGGWFPYVLTPGSPAGRALAALPSGFDGRVFMARPAISSDRDPRQLTRLKALQAKAGVPPQLFSQAAAYGTLALLAEALRSAGRQVSRDALIAEVEKLYRFQAGPMPPLTFGRNRRIGAADLRIVRAQ
jgi:ABC-type branched-subunit amino acid transport system substrate-binding protein